MRTAYLAAAEGYCQFEWTTNPCSLSTSRWGNNWNGMVGIITALLGIPQNITDKERIRDWALSTDSERFVFVNNLLTRCHARCWWPATKKKKTLDGEKNEFLPAGPQEIKKRLKDRTRMHSCTWIIVIDDKIRLWWINGIPGREIINMTKTEPFSVTRSFTQLTVGKRTIYHVRVEKKRHRQHFHTSLQTASAKEAKERETPETSGERTRGRKTWAPSQRQFPCSHYDNFEWLSCIFHTNVTTRKFHFCVNI